MKNLITLLFVLLLVSSCASTKKTKDQTSTASSITTSADGSSFGKAIVITEKSETTGIDAEYTWLRKNYPGSQFKQQSLVFHNKIPYDVMDIITSGGESKKIYFDISKFYGKF